MLKKLKEIFKRRKPCEPVPPKPSWTETVELMYGKSLSFDEEIVRVIYSKNKERRIVILKSDKGYLHYIPERLYELDDEEWAYFSAQPDALPAMWCSNGGSPYKSFYGTEQEVLNDLATIPEYRDFFEN